MTAWRADGDAWLPCDSLPLADRGFRHGMSVFETIAIVDGRALFGDAHLVRLGRAAADSGCAAPCLPAFDFGGLGTGLLRIHLTAGPGAPGEPFAGNGYAIFEEAEVGWDLPALRVETSSAPCLPRPGGWKTGNYWQNIDALVAAHAAGCDEALLFNPAGMLVGGAMANAFLLVDGEWMTPARACGARDGVVRAWVMESLVVREEALDVESTRRCRAAFLTNSRIGVRTVASIDGRPLGDACRELRKKYRDEILSR